MSYVGEPFEHDVFISYGRANRALGDGSPHRDWSLAFVDQLRTHLQAPERFYREPGRSLKVFLDEENLSRMGLPTPQIVKAACSSAILLIVMSEDYLRSDWCRTELHTWYDAIQAHGFEADGRIVVVRMQSTKEGQWDKRLLDRRGKGFLGYWFHHPSPGAAPFGYPIPDPKDEGEFQKPFFDLVGDLHGLLDSTRVELAERQRQIALAARLNQPNPTLYLHGRIDRVADWQQLCDQLSDDGFAMMPGGIEDVKDPAAELQAHKNRLETMTDCDALLAIGTGNIAATDADMMFIGRRVRNDLYARNGLRKPCGLLDIEMQAAAGRRPKVAGQLGLKWIDSTRPGWIAEVRHWLRQAAAGVWP